MRRTSPTLALTLALIGCGGEPTLTSPTAAIRQCYAAKVSAHEGDANRKNRNALDSDKDMGTLRDPADRAKMPASVLEAADFYYQNILQEDRGSSRTYQVQCNGTATFAVYSVSDGGTGWLEVFDLEGQPLGTARTDCGITLWSPRDEIRRRTTDFLPLEPAFVAERQRRAGKS